MCIRRMLCGVWSFSISFLRYRTILLFGIEFVQKQVTELVEGMNPIIGKSNLQVCFFNLLRFHYFLIASIEFSSSYNIKVLILNTMRRLTYLPQGVCSVQHFEYFFSVVQQFIQVRNVRISEINSKGKRNYAK